MKEIPLTQGYVALVDDEDYERLAQYKWHAHRKNKAVYAYHSVYDPTAAPKYSKLIMHRFILGITDPKIEVDHWDRDGLNNRRYNLRVATRAQNIANQVQHRNAKASRFKGVTWHKRDKLWIAQIGQVKRQIGRFHEEEAAAHAYDAEALKRLGAFARLNFPVSP